MERRTVGEPSNELAQARRAFDRCAWDDAYTRLVAADAQRSLDAEDLQRLAQSAYLTGRDEAAEEGWARAHQAFLDRDEVQPAVRCAFWLGMVLVVGMGAEARGGGWIARAHRLLEGRAPRDCAESGSCCCRRPCVNWISATPTSRTPRSARPAPSVRASTTSIWWPSAGWARVRP